jgi:hypothetical protein
LAIEAGYRQADLAVDGVNGLHVQFAELLPSWEAEVSHAGSMPGYSVVRVEVEGMANLPVHIWKEAWEGMMRRTGSKPDYGPYVLEFSPLSPGRYMVEPEGLGLWSEVELTGLEAIWIHFRKRTLPLGDNLVQPLGRTEQTAAVATEATTAAAPSSSATTSLQGPAAVEHGHYLFVWAPPQDPDELAALLAYVTAEQPIVGRDRWAAFDAERVTIVGATEESLELTEFVHALEAAGVEVDYLSTKVTPPTVSQ